MSPQLDFVLIGVATAVEMLVIYWSLQCTAGQTRQMQHRLSGLDREIISKFRRARLRFNPEARATQRYPASLKQGENILSQVFTLQSRTDVLREKTQVDGNRARTEPANALYFQNSVTPFQLQG